MSLQYIIDGCNVTHHPKFIKNIPRKPFDSRGHLIKLIISGGLCARGSLIWLVFDGHPEYNLKAMERNRLRIIFSRNQSADEKIKRILELTDNPKNTIVVSDDKEIIYFARLMRAQSFSVEEFVKDDNAPASKGVAIEEKKINYSQMCKINDELKKIWLK